jgi:hypothetical protein
VLPIDFLTVLLNTKISVILNPRDNIVIAVIAGCISKTQEKASANSLMINVRKAIDK